MKYNVFSYDIEATTNVDYEEEGCVRGYLFHFKRRTGIDDVIAKKLRAGKANDDEPDKFTFLTIEDTLNWMSTVKGGIYYDYNMTYDGKIILYGAIKAGMHCPTYDEERARREGLKIAKKQYLEENDLPTYYINRKTGARVPTYVPVKITRPYEKHEGTIEVLEAGGKFIQITLIFKQGRATFYDIGNKWTTANSLAELAKILGIPGKTALDVYTRRSPYAPVSMEEYIRVERDVEIVDVALGKMLDAGMTHATLAGDAYTMWKDMFIESHRDEWKDLMYAPRYLSKYPAIPQREFAVKSDWYKHMFPQRKDWKFIYKDKEYDLREAYRGGICYTNPRYTRDKKGTIHNVHGIDCNSEHPTSMEKFDFPVGKPIITEDVPLVGDYVHIVAFTATSYHLKPGHDPCWKTGNTMRTIEAQWEVSSTMTKDFIMTSDDFERFKMHYDIDFGFTTLVWFNFRKIHGSYIFGAYLNYWKAKKQEATEMKNKAVKGSDAYYYWSAQREIAKLMMNALYGKFGQNDVRPYQWVELSNHDAVVTRRSNEEAGEYFEPFSYHYLPIAIFITSYSRLQLYNIKAILEAHGCIVLYMDTDSIYFICPDKTSNEDEFKDLLRLWGIDIDSSKLGAWDLEHYDEKDFQMLREKTYQVGDFNGEYTTKCGGMPLNIKAIVRPEDFDYGAEFDGKLMPRSVPGGVVLIPTTYKIRKSTKVEWGIDESYQALDEEYIQRCNNG